MLVLKKKYQFKVHLIHDTVDVTKKRNSWVHISIQFLGIYVNLQQASSLFGHNAILRKFYALKSKLISRPVTAMVAFLMPIEWFVDIRLNCGITLETYSHSL